MAKAGRLANRKTRCISLPLLASSTIPLPSGWQTRSTSECRAAFAFEKSMSHCSAPCCYHTHLHPWSFVLLLPPSMLQCTGRHPLSLECFIASNRLVTMSSRAAACWLVLNDNMACCSSKQPAYLDIIDLLRQSARCGAGGAGKVQGCGSLWPWSRSDGKADCRICIQVMHLSLFCPLILWYLP